MEKNCFLAKNLVYIVSYSFNYSLRAHLNISEQRRVYLQLPKLFTSDVEITNRSVTNDHFGAVNTACPSHYYTHFGLPRICRTNVTCILAPTRHCMFTILSIFCSITSFPSYIYTLNQYVLQQLRKSDVPSIAVS